jgi:tRNA pseudouridine38-40 synthase
MARYQLRLAYDGTQFFGFQRQGKTRTVQSVFETVLREIGWQEEAILFAGRTDTGVHASGQVVVFSLEWSHGDEKLIKAINAKLPGDVAVREMTRVDADFHPRYDAASRSYLYRIYQQPERDPLQDRFAWQQWPKLDLERLDTAASMLIGKHDYAAFGRAMKPGASTIREVMQSCWNETDGQMQYLITGNAFLYHMVRRSVFLMVSFARGKINETDLRKGVEEAIPMRPGLAPARGLSLIEVRYPLQKSSHNGDAEILDNIA